MNIRLQSREPARFPQPRMRTRKVGECAFWSSLRDQLGCGVPPEVQLIFLDLKACIVLCCVFLSIQVSTAYSCSQKLCNCHRCILIIIILYARVKTIQLHRIACAYVHALRREQISVAGSLNARPGRARRTHSSAFLRARENTGGSRATNDVSESFLANSLSVRFD